MLVTKVRKLDFNPSYMSQLNGYKSIIIIINLKLTDSLLESSAGYALFIVITWYAESKNATTP